MMKILTSSCSLVSRSQSGPDCVVIVNATPVPRDDYRLGVPEMGNYREILNTDSERYAGSNSGNAGGAEAQAIPAHGRDQSIGITLPPLATLIFRKG